MVVSQLQLQHRLTHTLALSLLWSLKWLIMKSSWLLRYWCVIVVRCLARCHTTSHSQPPLTLNHLSFSSTIPILAPHLLLLLAR
jgi:hypothetical protein